MKEARMRRSLSRRIQKQAHCSSVYETWLGSRGYVGLGAIV